MCVVCAAARAPRRPGPLPADPPRVPWPEGAPAGGNLTWTGVAGLVLELDGTRIAFDPFVSRPGLLRVLFAPPRPRTDLVAATFADLDAVFVGHAHYDHAMDLPALAAAAPGARFYGGPTVVALARRQGVSATRTAQIADGETIDVGPFRATAIAARHGKVPVVRFVDRRRLGRWGPWTPFRYPQGEVLAFRVEAAGRTFHVQGSAGLVDEALARQARADLLLACLAARAGTPRYLERLGAVLAPKVLAPIHHDDFFRPLGEAPRPVATLDWPGFLADAETLRTAYGTSLWCPPRGVPAAW